MSAIVTVAMPSLLTEDLARPYGASLEAIDKKYSDWDDPMSRSIHDWTKTVLQNPEIGRASFALHHLVYKILINDLDCACLERDPIFIKDVSNRVWVFESWMYQEIQYLFNGVFPLDYQTYEARPHQFAKEMVVWSKPLRSYASPESMYVLSPLSEEEQADPASCHERRSLIYQLLEAQQERQSLKAVGYHFSREEESLVTLRESQLALAQEGDSSLQRELERKIQELETLQTATLSLAHGQIDDLKEEVGVLKTDVSHLREKMAERAAEINELRRALQREQQRIAEVAAASRGGGGCSIL
jgi:hypothetical protein